MNTSTCLGLRLCVLQATKMDAVQNATSSKWFVSVFVVLKSRDIGRHLFEEKM